MNKKTKILIIVESMLGGIRQHVADIVLGLNHDIYEVYLAYSDNRADEGFYEQYELLKEHSNMIRCYYMQRELSLSRDLKAYSEISKIIKRVMPDIVHCHSSKAGFVGRIAAKMCGVKQIYYTPNAYVFQNPELGRIKRSIYIMAERFLSRSCTTKTINVSKGEMECAIKNKLDKNDKFTLIYNGIADVVLPDKNEIRKANGFDNNQILIGVTSRCAEQKDPFTWLNVARRVIESNDNIHFVYIGWGDMEQAMKEWVFSHHLEERIHLLGYRNDASALVSMFDIYLTTALFEGLPYSMLEALRAGVPIVASDVTGNNEIVQDGVNGFLFKAKDVDKAAEHIESQINNNVIKNKTVKASFRDNFSVDTMIKGLENLYVERAI